MADLIGPGSGTNGTGSSINSTTTRPALYRIFGAIDTWFKDCSTPASQDGTAYQADFFNGLLGQLRTLIRGNGQLATGTGPVVPEANTSDAMLLTAVQLLIARGQPNAGTDTGSADALAVAPATPWPEYKAGARIWVIKSTAAGPNVTTAPTIAVSNLAAVTIVRRDGTALLPGDLPAGVVFCAEHDGTAFRLVSLTWGEVAGAVQSGKWLYGAATGTANAATVQLFPQQAPVDGQEILVKWPSVNTAVAPTFLLTGFFVKTVVRQGGGQIQPGDLGGYVPLIYDATLGAWRVNGFVPSDILALGGVVRVTDTAAASTVNALVGTAAPGITAYGPSQIFIFTQPTAGANTSTTPTGNVTGAAGTALGTLTFVKRDGSALAAGDLPAGASFLASLDASGTKLRVFGPLASDFQSTLANRNIVGSNRVVYTAPGSTTWTVPAGVTQIYGQVWGGGGGGGGATTNTAAGSGGGGGGYSEGVVAVTPGQSLTVTLGGPGSNGSASSAQAGSGGSSSLGSYLSATGGTGGYGSTSGAATTSGVNGNGSGGSVSRPGTGGGLGIPIGSTYAGGVGGSAYTSSIPSLNVSGAGQNGGYPGGGGNGASNNALGGAGAAGLVIISY